LFSKEYDITIYGLSDLVEKINQEIIRVSDVPASKPAEFIYASMMHLSNNGGFTADLSHLLNVKKCGGDIVDARVGWATIEPRKGQYNWELTDRLIEWANILKTPLILQVYWSNSTFPVYLRSDKFLAETSNGSCYFKDYPIPSHASESYKSVSGYGKKGYAQV